MSNNINTRSAFFPNSKTAKADELSKQKRLEELAKKRQMRSQELKNNTAEDASVQISDGVKDFSKIKAAADAAPERDNSAKIARLKAQIQNGTYNIDYDQVADRIMAEEFNQ